MLTLPPSLTPWPGAIPGGTQGLGVPPAQALPCSPSPQGGHRRPQAPQEGTAPSPRCQGVPCGQQQERTRGGGDGAAGASPSLGSRPALCASVSLRLRELAQHRAGQKWGSGAHASVSPAPVTCWGLQSSPLFSPQNMQQASWPHPGHLRVETGEGLHHPVTSQLLPYHSVPPPWGPALGPPHPSTTGYIEIKIIGLLLTY